MPCWIHRGAIADAQNICMGRDTKAVDKVRNQESTSRGHIRPDEIRALVGHFLLTYLVCQQKVEPAGKCGYKADLCI